MGVAVVRIFVKSTTLVLAALVSLGATPAELEMLHAFDEALTGMAYAASGLSFFAVVWAGFMLMADGSDERGSASSKRAVIGAIVGLVLVLSAKGVALALRGGVVPIP